MDIPQPTTGRRVQSTALTSGWFRAGKLIADRGGQPVIAVPIPGGTCYLTADGRVVAIDRDEPPEAAP